MRPAGRLYSGKRRDGADDQDMTELTTVEQFDARLQSDSEAPVFILKHSTTCPISAGAFRRVQDFLREAGDAAPEFCLVRVRESRPVSNAIADRLGVVHQSPQLLMVRGGRCVWHTSHYDVTAENIKKALRERAA